MNAPSHTLRTRHEQERGQSCPPVHRSRSPHGSADNPVRRSGFAADAAGLLLRGCLFLLAMAASLALTGSALAQARPYIGYAYPAGGQQGTTFLVRLGGQGPDDVHQVRIIGPGVTARVVDHFRRLNNQEVQLLNEQVRILKRTGGGAGSTMTQTMSAEAEPKMDPAVPRPNATASALDATSLLARLEKRVREFVQNPACAALSAITVVEITLAPDAEPGERELRLVTARGVSNPLPFHVGQLPEFTRKPMLTTPIQILGKEAQSRRKRPADEAECQVTLPCTLNGQIASGEVNRYRFEARKGQRLVITTLGRQLIPFIADAVPGWFQPVLVLRDANGRECAYNDDYRFKPDPTLSYEVPKDGLYILEVHDSIYRGREDFVYRITLGEIPFLTGHFPLGSRVGAPMKLQAKGWNLPAATLDAPAQNAEAGIQWLRANSNGVISNPVPFARDALPEAVEKEPNQDSAHAQKILLPIILNGRVDKTDDWDVFEFAGKANDVVVAEVQARRLDSPLDSVIKLMDAKGTLLANNDDHEDLCAGLQTHQADSYLMARLPADGIYQLHLGDTARQGGQDYAYRLRLGAPQPDFALRVVPSSVSLRSKSTATLSVHVARRDGFNGPIRVGLKNPPAGFACTPITLSGTQAVANLNLRTDLVASEQPVTLTVLGRAKVGDLEIQREAVPAEDRMQAFLWRQLVPARELSVLVFNPSDTPPPKRIAPTRPPTVSADKPAATAAAAPAPGSPGTPPVFTKRQITARLRQLKLLYEEDLLQDEFYAAKVAECEAAR